MLFLPANKQSSSPRKPSHLSITAPAGWTSYRAGKRTPCHGLLPAANQIFWILRELLLPEAYCLPTETFVYHPAAWELKGLLCHRTVPVAGSPSPCRTKAKVLSDPG